ncbi:MAG TPA: T9SS type A sorting domain-containing protein [Ignavibacteriaceae bacterium]|nr:T9SS type A sorting domain-containing protein [Ignavibacteriaceae bacterium]
MIKIIGLFFVYSTLSFSQYYVSENGDDNLPGSSDMPFKTLSKALSIVDDNEYIYVEYVLNGALLIEDQMDVTKNNVHIIGGFSIKDGEVIGKSNLKAESTKITKRFIEGKNLQGLEISNFNFNMDNQLYRTIWIELCSGVIINNCYFNNNVLDAILLKGTNNSKIINNYVDNINPVGGTVNSIGLEGFIDDVTGIYHGCNDNQILNNTIKTNPIHFGINLINTGNTSINELNHRNIIAYNNIDNCFSGIMLDKQTEILVFSNIISNCNNYGIQIANVNDALNRFRYDMLNSKIYNNTIYYCKEAGLYIWYGFNFSIINNLYYNNGKAVLLQNTKYQVVIEDKLSESDYKFLNNLYYIDNNANLKFSINNNNQINWLTAEESTAYLYINPELVNPASLDFHLTNSSFAAARGYNLQNEAGYILLDYDSLPRPLGFGYDIGAYEVNDNSVNYLFEIAGIPRTISPSSTTNIKNNNRYIVIDNSYNTNHVFESGGEIFYKKNSIIRHLSEGFTRGNTNPCIAEYNGNIYVVWQRDLGNSNTAIMFAYSNDYGVNWIKYVLTTVTNNIDPNPVIESESDRTLIVFSDEGLKSYFANLSSPGINDWIVNNARDHLISNPTLAEVNGSFILAYFSNNIIYSRTYNPDNWGNPINISSIVPGTNINANPTLSHSPGSSKVHIAWGLTTSLGNKKIIHRIYNQILDMWENIYRTILYDYQELPSLSVINEGLLYYVLYKNPNTYNYYLSRYSNDYWGVPQFFDDKLRKATLSETKYGSSRFEKVKDYYVPYNLETGSAYIPKVQDINPQEFYYRRITIQDSLGFYFSISANSLRIKTNDGSIRNINFNNELNDQFTSLFQFNEFQLTEDDSELIFDYEIESRDLTNLFNENYSFTPKLKIINNEYTLEFTGENKKFQKVISINNFTRGSKNIAKINFVASNLKEGVFYSVGHIQDYRNLIVNKEFELAAAKTLIEYNVLQNYPNPFNPLTKIYYTIPKQGLVSIKVYDILGKEITQLVNEVKQPGRYEVTFDGNSLSSGIYFYQIQSENYLMTKKMILMK